MNNIHRSTSPQTLASEKPNYRWPLIPVSVIILLSFLIFYYYSLSLTTNAHFPVSSKTLKSNLNQCSSQILALGEKFLWYAPHSGFNNQLLEFKNAILMAGILNRTLIVPPILDHHAVVLGSCPKFRVLDPKELRISVWDHMIELIQGGRLVSCVILLAYL